MEFICLKIMEITSQDWGLLFEEVTQGFLRSTSAGRYFPSDWKHKGSMLERILSPYHQLYWFEAAYDGGVLDIVGYLSRYLRSYSERKLRG